MAPRFGLRPAPLAGEGKVYICNSLKWEA